MTFTIATSEAVTVLDGGDGLPTLQLNDGEVATYSGAVGSSVNALTFSYTVQPGDNIADLQATSLNALPAGTTIHDGAGNNAVLTGFSAIDAGVKVDTIAPTATAITLDGISPNGASIDQFNVTFSEAVTGVEASDFTAVTTGTVEDLGISVSGSGASYTVSVYGVIRAGTLGLDLNASGTGITDLAGNAIAGGYANGPTYSLVVPCYCRGTMILTARGEVAVEDLAVGDAVVTASGAARPVRWIGRRSYAGRFARGTHVLPICIRAGALGDGAPRRDLWISPHHAMSLEGVLIEARHLVNGVSIVQVAEVEQVDYFHVELDAHDVIVAEGALSESFVDDDSRGMFQNAHEFGLRYPELPRAPARYCAPRRDSGPEVEAARRRILARAGLAESAAEPLRRAGTPQPRALVIDSWTPTLGHDGAPMRSSTTCARCGTPASR